MALEYHLTGTVIGGGLRLDMPVPLPDGTRVRVTIRRLDERAAPPPPTPIELPLEQPNEISSEKKVP